MRNMRMIHLKVAGYMIAVMLPILALVSCEETTGPGTDGGTVSQKLLIYADNASIPANGGSTLIRVKVYADNDTTNVKSGIRVSFSASQNGTIEVQNAITDASGFARAILYAGTRTGTAAVTASIENFSNSVFVVVTQGVGLVAATPASILADGVSQAAITATVIDSLGRPSPGVPVSFSASPSGIITVQAVSDQSGIATAYLRSIPSVSDITVMVTASTGAGKIAAPASVEVDDVAAAKTASTAGVIGTATVVFRGITVTGQVEHDTIMANGADSTRVTVTVTETTTGAPVEGKNVNFSTSLGALRSSSGTTDANGRTSVILLSGSVTGTAAVAGRFAEGLVFTGEVDLIKQLYLELSSNPSEISANGNDISTITATLYDTDNNPIAGETVYFTTTLGRIMSSGITNEWGEVVVDLKSSRVNGTAIVTARYGTTERTTPVRFVGADAQVLATPLILVADGEALSTVTATFVDASSMPVVALQVMATTTLGTLHGTGDDSGQTVTVETGTDGKVTVRLSSEEAGPALVTFTAAGLTKTVTVTFTDYTFVLVPSATQVPAGGISVIITASLRDRDGTMIPIAPADITFSPTLGAIESVVEAADGSVVATLVSSVNAGPATVTASIADPGVTASTTINFIAAAVGSIQLMVSRNFVRIGGNTVDITATVYDANENPKPGETVTFSIVQSPGGGEHLASGTAVTNDIGQAVVQFISGMTGSRQNGVTIRSSIGTVTQTVTLTISGQPESVVVGFDASNFVQNANGTNGVRVSAIVSDVNRNKVVDGTLVNFSLIGEVGVIEPEVATVDGVATAMLVYSPSDAGQSVTVVAASGGRQGTGSLVLPGAEDTVASIGVTPANRTLQADGVSATSFVLTLTGAQGEPLSGRTIICRAELGSVPASVVTGDPSDPNSAPGKAGITYVGVPSSTDLTDTLTFTAGGMTATATVRLLGITMEATVDPPVLPSDGQSKAQISVLIKETTSNIPISGKLVSFGAADGYINGTATTDASGVARTLFTSGYNPGIVIIRITYGNTLVETVDVTVSEVTARGIELFANPSQIAANGISSSTISALLRDDNFNPVVGELIRFATTLGTVTAADSTDENGRATAILTSERRNGEATITATFKEHVSVIPVNFTGVRLTASATPENLFAGGGQTTRVTAYLKDAAEVPIVQENISFAWYMNDVLVGEGTRRSDVQGRATVDIASTESGRMKIVVNGAGAQDSTMVTFTRMQFTLEGAAESVATGGGEIEVWAQLFDTISSTYIQGATVNFFTTLGTITSSGITDAQGRAHATLVSGQTAGIVTVSASTDVEDYRVSTEKTFTFVNAPPQHVNLRLDANIVSVGGNSSELIAVVTDQYGNPVSDTLVSFRILAGPAGGERIHPALVTTGPSGVASTYFYSGQIPSQFEAIQLQAQVNGIASNIATMTIAGAPETVLPSYQTGWSLEDIDNGDGTYTLPISATILDINSNGVVDGTTVYFNVYPPEGAALSPVRTANSVARSTLTYPAASAGREVTMTASAGGKEGTIRFSLPGFTISYLSVTAQPKVIEADGESTSLIKATLFDRNGSSVNVPDGTTVSFTTDGGTLDPVVARTDSGVAFTTLTSDQNPNRYVTVSAQSGLFEDFTYIFFEEIGSSVNQVADIDVEVDKTTIAADGIETAAITATLMKYGGEIVTLPTTVTFETDIGQITQYVRSDENGRAVATFSSGQVGTATIHVSVGNISSYVSINMRPGLPQSIQLAFTPNFVNVKGSGQNETLLINADVKDSKNNPVDDGTFVQFQLVGAYDPQASITPNGATPHISAPMATLNGRSTVSFHAGTKAGAVRVKAVVTDGNGVPILPVVSSETTQFLVFSGPPYLDLSNPGNPFTESRMTIYTGPINIFAYHTDYNQATVSVQIADKYNNPVPAGTAVWFTTTAGTISTSDAFTDENGWATVTLTGGNPRPTLANSSIMVNPNASLGGPATFNVEDYDFDGNGLANNGIGVVMAYTEGLDHLGRNVVVWNYAPVVFSGQVTTFTVVPDDTLLNLGESTGITITIADFNGNPIMHGSAITISTSLGLLSNNSITTGDPGVTEYFVSLTNDLDPLTDTAGNATVTVKLVSPNGTSTMQSVPISLTIMNP